MEVEGGIQHDPNEGRHCPREDAHLVVHCCPTQPHNPQHNEHQLHAHQGHSLDEPLPIAEEVGGAQAERHERVVEQDEGDRGERDPAELKEVPELSAVLGVEPEGEAEHVEGQQEVEEQQAHVGQLLLNRKGEEG